MSKVLVFGASGLLGNSLVSYLTRLGYSVASAGRSQDSDLHVDPLDKNAVMGVIRGFTPQFIVNLIAATNVDLCETDTLYAYSANVAVAENIAHAALALPTSRAHLVQISTDQLYDGPGLHTEDHVSPINVYALSKYAGELAVAQCRAAVLRTNFFGQSKTPARQSFTDWLVKALQGKQEFTLFDDVLFSALHMDSLCDVIHRVMQERLSGVFNVGCQDAMSKAEFGMALASALKLSASHAKIGSCANVALKAKRPADMSMNVQRLQSALNYSCPYMHAEITHAAKEYLHA